MRIIHRVRDWAIGSYLGNISDIVFPVADVSVLLGKSPTSVEVNKVTWELEKGKVVYNKLESAIEVHVGKDRNVALTDIQEWALIGIALSNKLKHEEYGVPIPPKTLKRDDDGVVDDDDEDEEDD